MFTVLTYVLALSGNLPSSFLNSLLSLGNQLELRLPLLLADKVCEQAYKLNGHFPANKLTLEAQQGLQYLVYPFTCVSLCLLWLINPIQSYQFVIN